MEIILLFGQLFLNT